MDDLADGHGEVDGEAELHEDAGVDGLVAACLSGNDLCVPCAGDEVHLDEDRCNKGADEVADCCFDHGQGCVAVGLAGEEDVGGHCGGLAAVEDEADEEPGVHEGGIGGCQADHGEC